MKRIIEPNIKVVDDFFEIPDLWRDLGLGLEYSELFPGFKISKNINEISNDSFHTLAKKLSTHWQFKSFPFLESRFSISTHDYRDNGIYNEENIYNFAALIFLNPEREPNSGVTFYSSSAGNFKKTVTVENFYNRCVIYDPLIWVEHGKSFGNSIDTGRMIIKIIGTAK